MTSWEWRRSVTTSVVLVDVAAARGVEPAEILRGTGIRADVLADPVGEVTAAQELALVRNLVTRFDDAPGLGADAGNRNRITMHGVYGLAVMSSPTILAALETMVRHVALATSFSRCWMEPHGPEVLLCVDDSELPADLRPFLFERDLAAAVANYVLIIGAKPPLIGVRAAGGMGDRIAAVLEHFDIPIAEGAEYHTVALEATELEQPMPMASPHIAVKFDRECGELLERRGLHQGVAGAVREMLMRQMTGRVSQEEVAAGLNLSLRTMRRRLAEEGTSYRQLCSETYGSLAEDLLSTGLTVEDVAFRMGYSGAPSFSNAFKQWRGVSPGRFARTIAHGQHAPR
ncbi:AraC family transcriptional regulator ligand-binding domain-containing protein [Nocardia sp. NPDC127579]|uniref:AraC family transcriptional regulator n=1 Tax=Nocardia sp. NPDC127579 TaxID=3345402 RepID=UPI00362C69CC